MMPKVSIIVPVYKVERYLAKCLDSILKQTMGDFEVICVNDGSPDKSVEVLKEYEHKDNRIRVISQHNQGLSVARNNGIKIASGKYVCFLDSDDILHPQNLEVGCNLMEKYDAELVQYRQDKYFWKDIDDIVKNVNKIDLNTSDVIVSDEPLYLGTHKGIYFINFNVTSKMYKRELLEGIEFIPGIHFEDYPHTYAVLLKQPRTVVVNEVMYYYMENEDSIFHQNYSVRQIEDYFKGIQYIFSLYSKEFVKERQFLAKDFLPNILEQQRRRCRKAVGEEKKKMYTVFAEELKYLCEEDLLLFINCRLHRYIWYKYIIKKYFTHNKNSNIR